MSRPGAGGEGPQGSSVRSGGAPRAWQRPRKRPPASDGRYHRTRAQPRVPHGDSCKSAAQCTAAYGLPSGGGKPASAWSSRRRRRRVQVRRCGRRAQAVGRAAGRAALRVMRPVMRHESAPARYPPARAAPRRHLSSHTRATGCPRAAAHVVRPPAFAAARSSSLLLSITPPRRSAARTDGISASLERSHAHTRAC